MIRAALILALLALSAPAAAKPSDGTVMRRTTLLVHDIERSARFYEILGFARWFIGPEGKVREGGLPVQGVKVGDPSRFIIMKGKDAYLGMKDMDGVARRLIADGFVIHKAPETSHIKSVSEEWDAKFMFVIDPDGHMLELTERLN
jgi:catechol 2,3-dioxygenase-like lactoylglutathione lyase family enzyme